MHITKMQGAGNDFIIIDNIAGQIPRAEQSAIAIRLCQRRVSVGADGMMFIERAEHGGDYAMRFYNADGSLGEMCGNGARCVARYGFDRGLAGDTQHIETTAGPVTGRRVSDSRYRVRLNDPSVIDLHRTAEACGKSYDCAYIELGDPGLPHAVVLMPGFEKMQRSELGKIGAVLRCSPLFPKGANVSFAEILGRDELRLVTFERGVEDFTLACGTGCGSAVLALTLRDLVSGENVRVHTPGGLLEISLTTDCGTGRDIFLTGPTVVVFEGEAELQRI